MGKIMQEMSSRNGVSVILQKSGSISSEFTGLMHPQDDPGLESYGTIPSWGVSVAAFQFPWRSLGWNHSVLGCDGLFETI
jgi:hypothetical protein